MPAKAPALFLFVLSILSVRAQQSDVAPYSIQFKSENYLAEQNIDTYISSKTYFEAELYNHNWYGVMQFNSLLSNETTTLLTEKGMRIIGYIPNNAYVVTLPQNFDLALAKQAGCRSMFMLKDKHKMSLSLYKEQIPEWAVPLSGYVDVKIELFENIPHEQILGSINNSSIELLRSEPLFHTVTLRIPQSEILKIASLPFVLWMEPIEPKFTIENLPGKTLQRSNTLTDGNRNLTGNGIRLGIWDGGPIGQHLDLSSRVTILENVGTYPSDNTDHAIHVCGTMAGAGNIDPFARGMASKATIFSSDFSNGSSNSEMNNAIANQQIVISQHSYGYVSAWIDCTRRDPYESNSREADLTINNNPFFFAAHAAGNSQSSCTSGWGTTGGKAAKNIMVVANITSAEAINSSSSFGPVQDGRIKPEISAVGTSVYSTQPDNTYAGGATWTGTSMATPVVSGVAAQLYERYKQLNANQNPPAALIKGIMCNTAKDVGNAGPDYKFGFGVLDALKSVRSLEANEYIVSSLTHGVNYSNVVSVPSGASKIKITLCWSDKAALANANPALVNDLDLALTDPNGNPVLPWILNPASPSSAATLGIDRKNNIEQITINNPIAGTYTIEVSGFAIALGSQEFAVTWLVEEPYLEITYPNGNEKLVPGVANTIHWNSSGINAAQTLQYSTDGGNNWTNISTTIASTLNQYSWTVPSSINTAKALIRVTSGSLTDASDAEFNIIRTPGSPTFSSSVGCNGVDVTVSWAGVTGATDYTVLGYNTTTNNWDAVAEFINSTSVLLSGYTLGQTYWFSVVASNNINGATSERCIAKSYSVSAPSNQLSKLTSITASSGNVCAGESVTLTAIGNFRTKSYQFSTSTGTILNAMAGSTTVLNSGNDDDPTAAPLNIGFTFNFNQTDYTQFSVSPDGWLLLGNAIAEDEYDNSFSLTKNLPKIFPIWDDLNTGTTGNVKTLVTGTAPNRILIVQWFLRIPRSTTSAANSTCQLWLYETSNKIEFRYGTMGVPAGASGGLCMGSSNFYSLSFSTNTLSTITGNNSNTASPASGRMYTFTPNGTATINWSPTTSLNTSTGETVVANNVGSSTTYTATLTNTNGCTSSTTYTLTVNPKPKAGFTINNATQPRNANAFVFTDTTSGTGLTRNWKLGDGNISTQNPVNKSYTAVGNYSIQLKTTTTFGCSDSVLKQIFVTALTPNVYATNLQYSNITNTSIRLTWTNGNGQQRYVLAKANTAVSSTLTDNTSYTANTQFSSGAVLSDNSFVVYQGTSNTVDITGLDPLTNYYFAVVEMSIDNGSYLYQPQPYLTGQNTTLPVKWLSFNATLLNNNAVQLDWATASEINNSHFIIERSEDLKSWINKGKLKGNGTINRISSYRFLDNISDVTTTSIYYRIKQVDLNGNYEYSSVQPIILNTFRNAQSIILYPNPATDKLKINHAFAQELKVEIRDLNGKIVYQNVHYASDSEIDLQEISAGFYIVKLYENEHLIHTEKLLKLR
jgi:hypothetical protein